jgi:hypothetical protein
MILRGILKQRQTLWAATVLTCGCLFLSPADSWADKHPCAYLEPQSAVVTREYNDEKGSLTYYEDSRQIADAVLPQLDPKKRIIIGFYEDHHVYLSYKGMRIMAAGVPGISVRYSGGRSPVLLGNIFVVLHDLPVETLAAFDRDIENFKSRRAITCARLACRFGDGAIGDIVGHMVIMPSTLLRRLMDYKRQGGNAEIVLTGPRSLEDSIRAMENEESYYLERAKNALVATPAALSIGYLILNWFIH